MHGTKEQRNWHPVEISILKHIGRHGLTYAECLHASGTRGVKSVEQAVHRLKALRKRTDIVSHRSHRLTYYTLAEPTREKLISMKFDALGSPTHPRILLYRFAMLQLCYRVRPLKRMLTKSDLTHLGLQSLTTGNFTNYYIANYGEKRTLGYACIDRCERGYWERLVRKTDEVAQRHLANEAITELSRRNEFEISVVTPLPEKAERVAERLKTKQQSFPIPVRIVPIPSLLQFVQPLPDPR